MSLIHLSVAAMQKGLQQGEFTAVELLQAHLDQLHAQSGLNTVIHHCEEEAMRRAEAADVAFASKKITPLLGIPLGVKDLFCTKGVLSTSCSHILDGFTPTYESTVTRKMLEAGAVMMGKTNMDEFAMGSTNETSYYGPAVNPWKAKEGNEDLVPGGSSGGSAAAVAAGICPIALGSDTGGSIRQPASFTGTVGMKPTYGRCSRWGMIAFASSLDQAGIFARSVQDTAIGLEVIMGHDENDSTSLTAEVPSLTSSLEDSVQGKVIGIPKEYQLESGGGMDEAVLSLWEDGKAWLQDAGATLKEITLPMTKSSLPTYYIIAPAEASSNLARYDGVRYGLRVMDKNGSLDDMYKATRKEGFGAEVKRRIMMGTYVLSAGYYDAYYKKAQAVRRLIANDFNTAFKEVDQILTPTTPTAAFPIGSALDPVSMYQNDIFTVPASLAGLPAISVPSGYNIHGLPLGLQIIGKPLDEVGVLQMARQLEMRAGFTGFLAKKDH